MFAGILFRFGSVTSAVVLYGACRVARIRSVKPDFFLDFELSKLTPLARLFFIGLWCQADKSGRMEDEAHKLKVQIIPWDTEDAEKLLSELAPKFITRYKTKSGEKYLQINSWEHQKPHHTEKESVIPPPLTVKSRLRHGDIPARKGEEEGEDSLRRFIGKESVQIPEDLKPNEPEIKNWLAYKRERGETYKPRGLDALYRALRAIPEGQRKAAIDQSMGNNWAGLFPPKGGQNGIHIAPKVTPGK